MKSEGAFFQATNYFLKSAGQAPMDWSQQIQLPEEDKGFPAEGGFGFGECFICEDEAMSREQAAVQK